MALSFCSDWGFPQDHHHHHQLFGPDFHNIVDQFPDQPAADYDYNHDQCQNSLCFDNNYDNLLLPCFSPPSDNLISLAPDIFPTIHEPESSYHFLKRRKSFEDCYANVNANVLPCFFDGFHVPVPEFHVPPPPTSYGNAQDGEKKGNCGGGGSLSAQSTAARQRRKKITEKTQELGKLIPGGTKMNTAEMFHAASKYVKWMQAQVAVLQLMASVQEETKKPLNTPELPVLLGSSVIQEKLYSEEKCLVPKKLSEHLGNDRDIGSKPLIVEDVEGLVRIKD